MGGYLNKNAAYAFKNMQEDAKKEGITLTPQSGYRPNSRQKELFENKVPTTLDNCKVVFKKVLFNPDDIKMKISNALSFYNICLDNTAIPLDDISPKVMQILKDKGLFDINESK